MLLLEWERGWEGGGRVEGMRERRERDYIHPIGRRGKLLSAKRQHWQSCDVNTKESGGSNKKAVERRGSYCQRYRAKARERVRAERGESKIGGREKAVNCGGTSGWERKQAFFMVQSSPLYLREGLHAICFSY